MKKYLILFTAVLLLIPGLSYADSVAFKLGYFFPSAKSDLWEIEFENMDFSKSSYQSTNFCFAYEYFVSKELSVMIGLDTYSKNKNGLYVGWVAYDDPDGVWAYPDDFTNPDYFPGHSFSVSITPIQLSLKLTPLGRRGKIIPYMGGGVGLYIYRVRMVGDMIDFSDPWTDTDFNVTVYPIYYVSNPIEDRLAIGFHGFGGFMMPVAHRMSLEVEFKYNYGKGTLQDFFEGFEKFDLSGYQITLGLNYWF